MAEFLLALGNQTLLAHRYVVAADALLHLLKLHGDQADMEGETTSENKQDREYIYFYGAGP